MTTYTVTGFSRDNKNYTVAWKEHEGQITIDLCLDRTSLGLQETHESREQALCAHSFYLDSVPELLGAEFDEEGREI